ncbi:UDP-N-acetyl glucosamine 2-epimerase [Vibrio comitans]|uniref:UDP-N-acetylglucosamine 2-epimerase domain-containing protein n=1 Tax=Vibrio comitans NBRC 102076 TaxID=1219078 RepID=A0A4Y3ISW1_9VIBR|nr:UDP-N-acetyl glucosamine 2-epimerase [Vibrio comitans]GEA61974.1 hypothetical protein VCO01S_31670 [Vibrio comitans NBRC 102076]
MGKSKKELLLVCYGGGHVKIMAALYLSLREEYDVSILALTTAANYLKERNIPYLTFASFDALLTKEVITNGKLLLNNLVGNNVDNDESVAYLGVSFTEMVEREGSFDLAIDKLNKQGRSCFLPKNALKKILETLAPDLVLTTNVHRAEMAALMSAKELGIPSVCINDNVWIEGGVKKFAVENICDYICVLSDEVKKAIIDSSSFPQNNIIVTGTPVFDNIKRLRKSSRKSDIITVLLADCELPEKNPRFKNATGDPNFEFEVRDALNELGANPEFQVIFRPHPNQVYDYSAYENIRCSTGEEDLHKLLSETDVVVTAISTVGIEGIAIGCGLVSLENTVYSAAGSYEKLGFSTGVTNADQLHVAIVAEVNKPKQLTRNLYEGLSTINITKLIENILSTKSYNEQIHK